MERHDIDWRDGDVPVSRRFDDPFFSLENGLAETAHVFLAGNDLPRRLVPGFSILELGFGTGLNLLATLAAGSGFRFTSFEAYPLTVDEARRAHAAFPELAPVSRHLLESWERIFDETTEVAGAHVRVVPGDARQTLPSWPGRADAVYLDGFSPAKNPELWQPDLLAEVARHMAPGATLATYTAAGHVRRALAEAGLAVERRQGYGRKRHMTVARKPP